MEGISEYVAELTVLTEQQHALDKSFQALRLRVAQEQPDLFTGSTDFLWAGAEAAEKFAHYLQGRDHYVAWLDGSVE